MNEQPIVSYIIPCFNQSGFLIETIRSIDLSYSGPKEIIVVDDHSSAPSTKKQLDEIQTIFPKIKIIYNDVNKGLSATRNIGLAASNGDYIQFLDADDVLLPGKIDYQIQHFRLVVGLDISITDYLLCDAALAEFTPVEPSIGSFEFSLNDFLFKWECGLSIPIHCGLFKRQSLQNIRFDESLTAKEDWVFWCRQAHLKRKIAFINVYGAGYRQHGAAMTKSKFGKMGQMWLRAGLTINDFLQLPDNKFLDHVTEWYERIYRNYSEKPGDSPGRASTSIPQTIEEQQSSHLAPINIRLKAQAKAAPTFSVVVPVYNHSLYLRQCFESILSQSYPDFEIVCVDDNSSDPKTREFLHYLKDQFDNVRVEFNEGNTGISQTIDKGIQLANGYYIALVDCDDYLPAYALEEVYNHIAQNPDVDYFFTDRIDIDANGEFLREARYGGYSYIQPTANFEDDLLDGMVASHLKVIKREAILRANGHNAALDGVQDYDLALRILANNGKFKYINRPLYFHRLHSISVTQTQTVNQFRKSNIARRNYCNFAYPKKSDPREAISFYKQHICSGSRPSDEQLANAGITQITPESMSAAILREEMRRGSTIILIVFGQYQKDVKYFLREYNSYFDLIHTNNPQTAVSIVGSLWNDATLWIPLFLEHQSNTSILADNLPIS